MMRQICRSTMRLVDDSDASTSRDAWRGGLKGKSRTKLVNAIAIPLMYVKALDEE